MDLRGAVSLESEGTLSQLHERVAFLLQEYNPELELQYIPRLERSTEEEKRKPFRVVHHSSTGDYIMGHFAESEVNHTLIAHIWKNDGRRRDVLADLETEEAAKEALLMREALDKHEEREDFAKTLLRSPLHTFKHNGKTYT